MTLNKEQLANARIIAQVGRQVGASDRDIQIALAVSLQESGLRNLNHGDRDSLGLFQQRPSMAWGSRQQVTNPEYAARAFFLGAGTNKGLLDYKERNSWSLTQAAQKVQRSAYPDAYAKHEQTAAEALRSLGGTPGIGDADSGAPGPLPSGESGALGLGAPMQQQARPNQAAAAPSPLGIQSADKPVDYSPFMPELPQLSQDEFNTVVSDGQASGKAAAIIALAKQYLNTPYKWGGESPLGFDCSGLLKYVFGKNGVELPRVSFQQATGGKAVDRGQATAGDIVWWDNSPRNKGADHVALFLGGPNNQILEAPRAGLNVRIRSLSDKELAAAGFTRYL